MRRALLLCSLLAFPLVVADTTVSTGDIREIGGVALDASSMLALWSTYDSDYVRGAIIAQGLASAPAIVVVEPPGYFTRDILSDASGGRTAVVVLYWPEGDGEPRADLLTLDLGSWTRREVPLDGLHRNVGGVAIAPDATVFVARSGAGGQDILTYTEAGMTATTLSTWLGFPDVAVDAAGVPHACISSPGGLLEWEPGGTRPILPVSIDLNAYYCAISIAADGSAAVLAAQPPLIGGSCYTPDLCVGTPGAGNVVSATRADEGEWAYLVSDVAFWGDLDVGHDPAGRFFGTHQESIRERIFSLTPEGIATLQFVERPHGSAMPGRNLAQPVVLARVDVGGAELALRLVDIVEP